MPWRGPDAVEGQARVLAARRVSPLILIDGRPYRLPGGLTAYPVHWQRLTTGQRLAAYTIRYRVSHPDELQDIPGRTI